MNIQEVAAPLLVPAIENNDFARAAQLVENYAAEFQKIDSLILGCTHYPLLKDCFQAALPSVNIISQDELMGAKLADYLKRHVEIDIALSRNGEYLFLVNNLNRHYQHVAATLFPGIPVREVTGITERAG